MSDDNGQEIPVEDAEATAKERIQEHLAKGGTVMAAIMVPVGALVLILDKGAVSAMKVGIGDIVEENVFSALLEMDRNYTRSLATIEEIKPEDAHGTVED